MFEVQFHLKYHLLVTDNHKHNQNIHEHISDLNHHENILY